MSDNTIRIVPKQYNQLISCILDMGEMLLSSGAEIMRVEDTIRRMCIAYGFERVDVFTITSSILLTTYDKTGISVTQSRRIHIRTTNFGLVESINALSRAVSETPMPLENLQNEIKKLKTTQTYPLFLQFLMYPIISISFSLFFGGSIQDSMGAACSGVVLFFIISFGKYLRINDLLLHMLSSLLTAFFVSLMFFMGIGIHTDKVAIGNIMLIIPGIALVISLRDMINGDIISGLLGFLEATLKALVVAIGFAFVIDGENAAAYSGITNYIIQIFTGGIGSMGFSVLFNVRGKKIIFCGIGGMLGWAVYLLFMHYSIPLFWSVFAGTISVALLSECLARLIKVPVVTLLVSMLIPHIPGGDLYYTMRYLVRKDYNHLAVQTQILLSEAGAIALGIICVASIWSIINRLHENNIFLKDTN